MGAPSLFSALEHVLGSCALISLGIVFASEWKIKELKSEVIEFAPSRIATAAWLIIAVYLADFTSGMIKHSRGNPLDLANAACLGLLALVIFFWIPETLIVSPEGLQQFYWFRRNKHIRWNEIVEINTGRKTKAISILAVNGTKIVYRGGLTNRPLLLSMIKRYCGDELPTDFPRDPISQS